MLRYDRCYPAFTEEEKLAEAVSMTETEVTFKEEGEE